MWTRSATAAIAGRPCARRVSARCATCSTAKCAWQPSWVSPRYARSNPVLAFFLGFLPGMGAFYNEQYGKGMIHLAIFLVLFISGVDGAMSGGAEAALWICVAGLWVYMPIDAYRTAKARQAGETLSDPLDAFTKERPIGPILLIGAGVLMMRKRLDRRS